MPRPRRRPPTRRGAKAIPPGFDVDGFVRQAKMQFIRLQAAYDAGDRAALAEVMTPEMLAEIARELAGRGEHQPTEVVSLDADVLEVTTEGAQPLGERALHGPRARGRRGERRSRSTKSGTSRSRSTARPAGCSPASSRTPDAMPLLDPAAALANRVLERQAWARERLAEHAGACSSS